MDVSRYRKHLFLAFSIWLLVFGFCSVIWHTAIGGSRLSAETLVRAYESSTPLQPGLVVALEGKNVKVKIAAAKDPASIYGVVIDPSEAPIALTNGKNSIYIATSGKHSVLVTDQKGIIKPGDYISMSNIDGIAARADTVQSFVLGRAAEGFDGKNRTITSVAGVRVARISVDILPKGNPTKKSGLAAPESLRKVAESIAGNPVGVLKIYLAVLVLLVSGALAAILVTVGVRSGIVSIGRNPLSRKSIMRGLTKTVIMAILIFTIGLLGVYLLLKL